MVIGIFDKTVFGLGQADSTLQQGGKDMLLLDTIIVGLAVYSYFDQLLLLRKCQSIGSFSVFITAIVIVSNTLKFFYWFTEPYKINLFIQCLLLITVNLLIIRQCVSIRNAHHHKSNHPRPPTHFWYWHRFTSYLNFTLWLALATAVLTEVSLIWKISIVGEMLGYVSTVIEVTSLFPQLYANCRQKSVQGLSRTMVAIWAMSDATKTAYFYVESQPLPFILTGIFQLLLDCCLILQMFCYRRLPDPPKQTPDPHEQLHLASGGDLLR